MNIEQKVLLTCIAVPAIAFAIYYLIFVYRPLRNEDALKREEEKRVAEKQNNYND